LWRGVPQARYETGQSRAQQDCKTARHGMAQRGGGRKDLELPLLKTARWRPSKEVDEGREIEGPATRLRNATIRRVWLDYGAEIGASSVGGHEALGWGSPGRDNCAGWEGGAG